MGKPVLNFRPWPETEVRLAELMDRWSCNLTTALNRSVEVAAEARPEAEKETSDYPKGGRLAGPRETTGVTPPQITKILTRAEREAKIDAFQRKMAKGKK